MHEALKSIMLQLHIINKHVVMPFSRNSAHNAHPICLTVCGLKGHLMHKDVVCSVRWKINEWVGKDQCKTFMVQLASCTSKALDNFEAKHDFFWEKSLMKIVLKWPRKYSGAHMLKTFFEIWSDKILCNDLAYATSAASLLTGLSFRHDSKNSWLTYSTN